LSVELSSVREDHLAAWSRTNALLAIFGLSDIAAASRKRPWARPGLHRTEISLLERAQREPRLSTIVRLARGLEVRPSELLNGIH